MYVVLSYYWYLVRNVIRLVSLDKSRIVPTPQEKHVGEASFNLLPLLIQTNCQFVKIIHIGLEGPTSFLPPPDSPTYHRRNQTTILALCLQIYLYKIQIIEIVGDTGSIEFQSI